jgi:hypothetical protein
MCKADNLTAICELTGKYGSLNISWPYGPPWPVTGIAFISEQVTLYYESTTLTFTELEQHNIIHDFSTLCGVK